MRGKNLSNRDIQLPFNEATEPSFPKEGDMQTTRQVVTKNGHEAYVCQLKYGCRLASEGALALSILLCRDVFIGGNAMAPINSLRESDDSYRATQATDIVQVMLDIQHERKLVTLAVLPGDLKI